MEQQQLLQGSRKGKAAANETKPPAQPPRKCPRCESVNTKFCYYNNYSSSQPRYFCRACRRYWTEGGTLRNFPRAASVRRAAKHSKRPSSSSTSGGCGLQSAPPLLVGIKPPDTVAPPPLYFSGLGGVFLRETMGYQPTNPSLMPGLRLPPALPGALNPSLMLGPPASFAASSPVADEGDRLFNDLFGGVQDGSAAAPRPHPSNSSGPFL